MTKIDKKRFATAMNWLAERVAKDGEPTELTKETLQDYFEALKALSILTVETAVKNYFANATYKGFPLPGDIRKQVVAVPDAPTVQKQIPECPTLPPELAREYARDAAKVFALADTEGTPHDHIIGAMQTMERAYPGFGWGEEAKALNQHYLRRENQRT